MKKEINKKVVFNEIVGINNLTEISEEDLEKLEQYNEDEENT